METIFKSEHGEVWKSPTGYGTYTAGHMLCVDLAKEIERLRKLIADWENASQCGHPSPCTLGPLCPYCEIERLRAELAELKRKDP
jgi:hypothetical protein